MAYDQNTVNKAKEVSGTTQNVENAKKPSKKDEEI